MPAALVPISVLPLLSDGSLDEAALLSLEIVDQDLAERWETALKAKVGIKKRPW
jgi:hypothetical protein